MYGVFNNNNKGPDSRHWMAAVFDLMPASPVMFHRQPVLCEPCDIYTPKKQHIS